MVGFFQVLYVSLTDNPRWKKCITITNTFFPAALSHLYVEKAFSASSKAKVPQLLLLGLDNNDDNNELYFCIHCFIIHFFYNYTYLLEKIHEQRMANIAYDR